MVNKDGFPGQVGLEVGLQAGLDSILRVAEWKEHWTESQESQLWVQLCDSSQDIFTKYPRHGRYDVMHWRYRSEQNGYGFLLLEV